MMAWRRMAASDLDAVHALADRIHLDHPEDRAVLAERQRLFAPGCLTLHENGKLFGYAIAHPARFGKPVALNTLLDRLPDDPTTFYIHDVAISPEARGGKAARKAVELLVRVARRRTGQSIACRRQPLASYLAEAGFRAVDAPSSPALRSYGDAVFMVRNWGKPPRR